jgi:site-specific DNA-methyltransferase (cytosine-N4-specific)
MPESVTDRCTKAHEYLFLLTKSSKYYFDNEAIKEPSAQLGKTNIRFGGNKYGDSSDPKHATKSGNEYIDNGTRNRRSVWTIPTKPFRGAHFAVMPEALVEPCILATSQPGDTILDPFTGSGTVAVVALRHERNFIGTELNTDYVNIAKQRITDANPMFNNITIN